MRLDSGMHYLLEQNRLDDTSRDHEEKGKRKISQPVSDPGQSQWSFHSETEGAVDCCS
jgi:hypothetical protein